MATAEKTQADEQSIKEARKELIQAVKQARKGATHTGPLYAEIVKRVMACVAAGMVRSVIAGAIHEAWTGEAKDKAPRGLAARYVTLARYELRNYTSRETKVRGVDVAGVRYSSPVEALASGKTTFNMVYSAWRAAVVPQTVPVLAKTAVEAAVQAILRLRVRYGPTPDDVHSLKVVDDPRTLASALATLVTTPKIIEVLPLATRSKVEASLVPFLRRQRAA